MQFGCFVQLEGVRGRYEGLVHISRVSGPRSHMILFSDLATIYILFSFFFFFKFDCCSCVLREGLRSIFIASLNLIAQLRAEGRVKDVGDVVKRGQKVKVKVLSVTGSKLSLSMKVGKCLVESVCFLFMTLSLSHLSPSHSHPHLSPSHPLISHPLTLTLSLSPSHPLTLILSPLSPGCGPGDGEGPQSKCELDAWRGRGEGGRVCKEPRQVCVYMSVCLSVCL